MIAHEYAHEYAAFRNGVPTAYQDGRLTWNPAKHIDPFMTILLPIMTFFFGGFIFGGAKPVPVNPRNFRRYKRADIIVSLAGVATNLVIAAACAPLIVVIGLVGQALPALAPTLALAQTMLLWGIIVNAILVAFNLLPIPPLDGSHVMKHLLPPAWSLRYQQVGQYGLMILIALLYFGRPVLAMWMAPANAFAALLIHLTAGFRLAA